MMPKYIVEMGFRVDAKVQIEAESEDEALDKAYIMTMEDTKIEGNGVVEYANCLGTVEEIARLDRQKKILNEMKKAKNAG